ncbi:RNA polymerase subunit sigma-54 [Coprothermobacteraceae bacterium]|nr:RNA polymerase subunit sigma-54 [Coprothermobacteraceae bacterium]
MAWHKLRTNPKLVLKTKQILKPHLSKGLELSFVDFANFVNSLATGAYLEEETVSAPEVSIDWDMVEAQIEAVFTESEQELAFLLLRNLDQYGFLGTPVGDLASAAGADTKQLEGIRLRIAREVEPYGLCSTTSDELKSILKDLGLPVRSVPIETEPMPGRPKVPDFVVRLEGEELKYALNEKYENLVANAKGVARMVAEYRADLIDRVAEMITSKCRNWFISGIPVFLTLDEAARNLGVSKSTASRLVRGKYFEFGGRIWPLSMFLGRSVKGIPQLEVLMAIRDVTEEDSSLTDDEIAQLLRIRKGWRFSRRTINKYRNILKKGLTES